MNEIKRKLSSIYDVLGELLPYLSDID